MHAPGTVLATQWTTAHAMVKLQMRILQNSGEELTVRLCLALVVLAGVDSLRDPTTYTQIMSNVLMVVNVIHPPVNASVMQALKVVRASVQYAPTIALDMELAVATRTLLLIFPRLFSKNKRKKL
jgi:hypothetical protein